MVWNQQEPVVALLRIQLHDGGFLRHPRTLLGDCLLDTCMSRPIPCSARCWVEEASGAPRIQDELPVPCEWTLCPTSASAPKSFRAPKVAHGCVFRESRASKPPPQPAEVWRGVPSQRKSRRSRETQPSAESLRSDSTEIRAHHKLAAVNYGTIFGASVFTQECACCILVTVHSVYVLSSSLRMSDLATPWSTLPYGSLRRCHCETGAGRARPIRYPDPPNC